MGTGEIGCTATTAHAAAERNAARIARRDLERSKLRSRCFGLHLPDWREAEDPDVFDYLSYWVDQGLKKEQAATQDARIIQHNEKYQKREVTDKIRAKILSLRKKGWSYDSISRHVGINNTKVVCTIKEHTNARSDDRRSGDIGADGESGSDGCLSDFDQKEGTDIPDRLPSLSA